MPGTNAEILAWVTGVVEATIMPDDLPRWEDGTAVTPAEERELQAFVRYELETRARARATRERPQAQRKALRLLQRFLSPRQRRQLAGGSFVVETPSGRRYRFSPWNTGVSELERHGKRWYESQRFCLHPPEPHDLPNADVTLAQFLLLSSDEDAFRREANATAVVRNQLWNGAYLRRMRQATRERAARAAAGLDPWGAPAERVRAAMAAYDRAVAGGGVPAGMELTAADRTALQALLAAGERIIQADER